MDDSRRPRCSDAARLRADPLLATAPTAARLLLIEVPGPWGRAGLTAARLDPQVAAAVSAAAEAAGVRVQLIRRPGRHPAPRPESAEPLTGAGPFAWAIADPSAKVVRWGSWQHERELLGVDPAQPLDPGADAGTGPQRLALVCTHSRHDLCCAVLGRPVAAAVAAGTDRQTWETSHLGGDRFAANLLLLPEGEVFGRLDGVTAVAAARALDGGRLELPHYRGRVGRAPIEQAGVHLAAQALDDSRLGAVRVLAATRREAAPPEATAPGVDRWQLRIGHGARLYRGVIAAWWSGPELLSCSALAPKPARRFALESLQALQPIDDGKEAEECPITR